MARRIRIVLEDDLTGEVLEEGRGETLNFALDGQGYEIDLSGDNARQLREALKPYLRAGRKTTGRAQGNGTGRAGRSASRRDTAAVRAWASSNGYQVSARGRIPSEVFAAYDATH